MKKLQHCNSLGLSTVKRSAVNGSDTVVCEHLARAPRVSELTLAFMLNR